MNQNVPIPCHGEENVILIPRRDAPARKNFFFWPQEFSQGPAPSRNSQPNAVSRKKTPWLSIDLCLGEGIRKNISEWSADISRSTIYRGWSSRPRSRNRSCTGTCRRSRCAGRCKNRRKDFRDQNKCFGIPWKNGGKTFLIWVFLQHSKTR